MTIDQRTEIPDAAEIKSLWFGLLVPPVAFLLNLELAYALVPAACAATNLLLVHLVHAACLLLAIGGGLVAWRTWKARGSEWPGEEGGRVARSRFMAGSGVVGSGLFALVILAQWIPSFVLNPCQ
jgi:TRAP-type C4-dicarboxylate transport system permease small subunit